MSPTISRVLIGGFLIAHALIHASYLSPAPPDAAGRWPFQLDRSWLLTPLGVSAPTARLLGSALVVLTVGGLVLAGLGLVFTQGWWRPVAVAGAAGGLLLLGIYWHVWLVLGIGLNVGIIWALLWAHWPNKDSLHDYASRGYRNTLIYPGGDKLRRIPWPP